MLFSSMEMWELLLDGTAFCLCGVAIFLFINRWMENHRPRIKMETEKPKGNLGESLLQLVSQSEKALANISDTLKIEYKALRELVERGEIPNHKSPFIMKQSNDALKSSHKRCPNYAPGADNLINLINDHYGEAVKLVDLGMSASEIHERIKIPKSEIALILKFRKGTGKSTVKGRPHV